MRHALVTGGARSRNADHDLVNGGSGRPVTILDTIRGLEEALGLKAELEHLPLPPGDVPQTWADIGKASRLLGYQPSTTLREGSALFTTWFREAGGVADG